MSTLALTARIARVSVRDDQFEVVKVLTPAERAEFQRYWDQKQEVKAALADVGGAHFALDIKCEESGGRWLYKTTGYVQFLSKKVTPVYKLRDPEAFNKLIGAVRQQQGAEQSAAPD
jgi:hypothetical protein